MIKFKKDGPDRFAVEKYYGICFESHPKRKGVKILWGRYVYSFWTGRSY